MTSRERLQYAYELAFYPPRLNEVWHRIAKQPELVGNELGELLDQAWLLHQGLPERGYASQRALNRYAPYRLHIRNKHNSLFYHPLFCDKNQGLRRDEFAPCQPELMTWNA